MRLPRIGLAPLTILSIGILISALARGVDFIIAPNDSSVTMSAIAEWADPTTLGVLLIILSCSALIGLLVRSAPAQAISHIALCALFLVMGAVSFFPVVTTLGWGWRAPVSYILGSAVVHWCAAHSWFNRWAEANGKRDVDS